MTIKELIEKYRKGEINAKELEKLLRDIEVPIDLLGTVKETPKRFSKVYEEIEKAKRMLR